MNFCPGSKNSIIGKPPRKPQDMTELRAKYFWIVFTIKLKRNSLRHELEKYMLKRALMSR
jgi:hypothetical protein